MLSFSTQLKEAQLKVEVKNHDLVSLLPTYKDEVNCRLTESRKLSFEAKHRPQLTPSGVFTPKHPEPNDSTTGTLGAKGNFAVQEHKHPHRDAILSCISWDTLNMKF